MSECPQSQGNINDKKELIHEIILEDDRSSTSYRRSSIRHDDSTIKEEINTDTKQFDELFARSQGSPSPPSPHPRCYSSSSPSTAPFQCLDAVPSHSYARSQPHLITLNDSSCDIAVCTSKSVRIKRQTLTLTPMSNAVLRSSLTTTTNTSHPNERLGPLARSCSYKRPQSMKKYRQQKQGKEQEQKEYSSTLSPSPSPSISSRKYSAQNNNIARTVTSDSVRKSISCVTSRASPSDIMANDDQCSSPKVQRSTRIGK
jgi:hypothetical protein